MKHVLVTGGNGFIGRYVVAELLVRGYHPLVLDTSWREPVKGADLKLGDIRDATAVNEAVAHVDGVIHLAGVLGTQETITNPRPAAETNVLGGLNVLEAVMQYQLPAVNIAVGNYWMTNTYSITKNTIERFADMMNRYRGGRISVVRALNAYGARQSVAAPYGPSKVRKVMPSFICRALAGEPIEIYGDGEQVMDMIYVSDLARVLVSALERTADGAPPSSGDAAFSAGTGRPTTVNQIAEAVVETVGMMTGRAATINRLPMRPGEDANSVVLGDPKTLVPLGIQPGDLISLEEGVQYAVRYFIDYMANRG